MQTIRITITTPTPTNIVIKECAFEKSDGEEKLAELLKKIRGRSRNEIIQEKSHYTC